MGEYFTIPINWGIELRKPITRAAHAQLLRILRLVSLHFLLLRAPRDSVRLPDVGHSSRHHLHEYRYSRRSPTTPNRTRVTLRRPSIASGHSVLLHVWFPDLMVLRKRRALIRQPYVFATLRHHVRGCFLWTCFWEATLFFFISSSLLSSKFPHM